MKARRKMSSLKREFLEKWIKGLQICINTTKKNNTSTVSERKNAIKLSADVAIAATGNAATRWRRAVLNDAVSRDGGVLVERIVGQGAEGSRTIACSRRILRRSHAISGRSRRGRRVVPCSRRRRALQRVVPGGEEMDGVRLLRETLDYIVSLRAQVDVMRRLVEAAAATARR